LFSRVPSRRIGIPLFEILGSKANSHELLTRALTHIPVFPRQSYSLPFSMASLCGNRPSAENGDHFFTDLSKFDTWNGSWPTLVNRGIDELFWLIEQARNLGNPMSISSSFTKVGHEPQCWDLHIRSYSYSNFLFLSYANRKLCAGARMFWGSIFENPPL
jgi:hypothetical protein